MCMSSRHAIGLRFPVWSVRLAEHRLPDRVRLNKRLEKLKDQAEETRLYEEKIHHLADQMISIDLDDGVKHNYAIFQDVP